MSAEGAITIDDHELAARLATSAGNVLAEVQAAGLLAGKPLGAAGDLVSHHYLMSALSQLRPDDAILSEEGAADPARLGFSRVWIVDPLDGTREYGECRTDWAVHVSLCVDGVPGPSAVALPGLGLTLSTGSPRPIPAISGPIRMLVSRSRPPAIAEHVASVLGAEQVPMGSAGAKAMAVARGEAHAYVHAGGQYEWDSAAPVGVALAMGLHCSRLDGSPLRYNQSDPLLPDLVICRPELATSVLAAIASAPA